MTATRSALSRSIVVRCGDGDFLFATGASSERHGPATHPARVCRYDTDFGDHLLAA